MNECVSVFRELYNRCDIAFYDKNVPADPGFTLTLNQRMTYPEVRKWVKIVSVVSACLN